MSIHTYSNSTFKMKRIKTILTVALLGLATLSAHAQSGDFGENNALHWELVDGTLTISGTGEMDNYSSNHDSQPWDDYYEQITEVVIENGVTSIGNYAFSPLYYLSSVTIPESVTSIGGHAFSGSSLTSVTIPENVTSIGAWAFSSCYKLSTVYFNAINCTTGTGTGTGDGAIFYGAMNLVTSIYIGNEVETIPSFVFKGCKLVTSITIPNSVTSIGEAAFSECEGLTSVTIPESVTRIEDSTFSYCSGLTSITIPNSVTSIGSSAFYGCTGLTSVTIHENMTSIGVVAFGFCSNLTTVYFNAINCTIPGSSGSVGAFENCYKLANLYFGNEVNIIRAGSWRGYWHLTSVSIGNSVTSIGESTFSHCTGLTSITIPESVTSIANYSFESCTGLTSVTNLNPEPQSIYSGVFSYVDISAATLYVPFGSKAAYQSAPVWQDFGTIIGIGPIEEPYYTAVTQGYDNSMTFTAILLSDGVELQSDHLEIGAFVNGECRGSVILQHFPESTAHPYLGFLVVYGDDDDNISFQVYDHDTGKEYTASNAPIGFVADDILGNPAEPYAITIADISFPSIGDQIYGTDFSFEASSESGSISITCSPAGIIELSPGLIPDTWEAHILKAGTVTITAHQEAKFCDQPVTIDKAPLTLTGRKVIMEYGIVPDVIQLQDSFDVSGWKYTDGLSLLSLARPSIQIAPSITSTTPTGFYPAAVLLTETGQLSNYTMSYIAGDLEIVKTPEAITVNLPLNEGWSWISVNVSSQDPSLMNQFKSSMGNVGNVLKGRNEFIQTPGWIGTLSEINNTAMYMVNTLSSYSLPFTGLPVDPASTPVSLLTGWNWIGYTPQASLPINEALANLNPQDGDQIKSQYAYADYVTGTGWVGLLTQMNPGYGYKYFSQHASVQSLVYPAPPSTLSGLGLRTDTEALSSRWTADRYRYPNNMTLTYIVSADNVEWQSPQIEIGAFCGNECRGSVMLSYLPQLPEHPYIGFLVVYGDGNEEIQLKIYDHATGKEYMADNRLWFAADAINGSPAEPYRVVASTTGICNVSVGSVSVFLDASGEHLNIRCPWSDIDQVEIIDLHGRILWHESGFASESVSVSTLVKGIYLLKLVKDNQVSVYRFVK